MSYIVPAGEISIAEKKAYRGTTVESGIQRALYSAITKSREGLVPTPLFASDCGMNRWVIGRHVGNKPFTWINHRVSTTAVIVFYKVVILSPTSPGVSEITFRIGATGAMTKAKFELSQLYSIGAFLETLRTVKKADLFKMSSLAFDCKDQ